MREIVVIREADLMESDDKKGDVENLKEGLSSREDMERWGYGKRERVKNNSSK